ncbi:MAG: EspA/EspE family type VII secretion system effector [Mycolicibacterium neoaurum]|uniref:TPR repeat region-containing protein n=1 Tax=Mycolicibacterium neoaurum TaxID=1795 RepID=UPI002FF4E8F7
MGALEGFLSTWDKARQTFGAGAPQSGDQFDQSAQLQQLQSTVQTAAPGSAWSGTAANAYGEVNKEHARVLGELAVLDKRLANHVNESANVVATGRQNLDNLRQWVVDAAASVPPGKNREQLILPIVQKGLGELSGIVSTSNSELNRVAGDITKLGTEWDALQDQKFGGAGKEDKPEQRDDEVQLVSDEEPLTEDAAGGEPNPEQVEDLVRDALAGDQQAAGKVDDILDTIGPEQLQPHVDPNNPNSTLPVQPLSTTQAEVVSQMQRQMSKMSLDDMTKLKNDLGDHGDILGDSMQVMSDPDVQFPVKGDGLFLPEELDTKIRSGSAELLPESVQQAINAAPVTRDFPTDPDSTTPVTKYPSGEDLRKVSELISAGDAKFQQGSELDRTMMDRAIDVIHGGDQQSKDHMWGSPNEQSDAIAQDILKSAGRDTVVDHDLFTSPNGVDNIKAISEHNWADDGQAARTMTDWIDDAADPQVASFDQQLRAGETAQALADYLGNPDNKLLDLGSSGLGGGTESLGNRNHLLVQSYAEALIPYQGEMVGEDKMPGFSALENPNGSDLPLTRQLFAVIDSDETAARNFNAHAYEQITQFQREFAGVAAQGPNIDVDAQASQGMARAGTLAGLVEGGAMMEAQARGEDALAAATSTYEIKKNALEYLTTLGTDKVPFAGGLIDAMGKDAFVKTMLGESPTLADVAQPPNIEMQGSQDFKNAYSYIMADALIQERPDGPMPPSQWMTDDGQRLKTPEQVLAEVGGADKIDDYYRNLYSYLENPENYRLAQPMDQFDDQYKNAAGKK